MIYYLAFGLSEMSSDLKSFKNIFMMVIVVPILCGNENIFQYIYDELVNFVLFRVNILWKQAMNQISQ